MFGVVRRAATIVSVAGFLVAAAAPQVFGQAPAGSLAIDVQVVDRDGRPLPGLTADKFTVEVNGRARKVVSIESIDATAAPDADSLAGRQTYFIAVDALSFGPGASNQVIAATKALAAALPPTSLVGLVTFPAGPTLELSTDRAALAAAIDGIGGQRQASRSGTLGLGAGDAVEFLSANDRLPITQRFCGVELAADNACPQIIEQEANVIVGGLEAQARTGLGWLAEFSTRLAKLDGRKVVILVSAGMPVSERPGGRPDVGDLPTVLAEAATRADVAFYTMLLERLSDNDGGARQAANASRDRDLLARWLDQFSSSMGGALMRVQAGQTGDSFARVVRETASYYRVVVESPEADSGARPQRLRVRVDQRGSTIRSRTLVKGR